MKLVCALLSYFIYLVLVKYVEVYYCMSQMYNIGIHSFKRLYSVYSYKIFPILPMLCRWFILFRLFLERGSRNPTHGNRDMTERVDLMG